MSSTARGATRQPDDFYETPPWPTTSLLRECPLPGGRWIEPAAGSGAIIRAVQSVRRDIAWSAMELRESERPALRETGAGVTICDFLQQWTLDGTTEPLYDVAITNPPFFLAMQFIERSLSIARTVAVLQRTNFLASTERADFMREYPPDVYQLPHRPSFTEHLRAGRGEPRCEILLPPTRPTGKPARCARRAGHPDDHMLIGTDSCEYAWFVWGPERHRPYGRIQVLAPVPVALRSRRMRAA